MIHELLKDAVITTVSNAVAAGTSAVNTSVLDMTGFDACCFIVKFNTVVDASVLTLTAFGNTASSTSSPTPVAITGGATAAVTASTSSNTVLVCDVIRPVKRYLFATLTRTAQNATIDSILAIQYRSKSLPVSQPASVAASVVSTPEV